MPYRLGRRNHLQSSCFRRKYNHWEGVKGTVHPWRLTWNLRIYPWKRKIIFQTIIFMLLLWYCGLSRIWMDVFCPTNPKIQPHTSGHFFEYNLGYDSVFQWVPSIVQCLHHPKWFQRPYTNQPGFHWHDSCSVSWFGEFLHPQITKPSTVIVFWEIWTFSDNNSTLDFSDFPKPTVFSTKSAFFCFSDQQKPPQCLLRPNRWNPRNKHERGAVNLAFWKDTPGLRQQMGSIL